MFSVSYAPEYQVVLSRRCPYACGYCNFPQTPSPLPPSRKMFRRMLRSAARLGANQVTLTAGEDIAELPEISNVCRYYGYRDWWEYLRELCRIVLETQTPRPMMPVLEVGAIPVSELRRLRESAPLIRLMLDSGDERLLGTEAHAKAPQKAPAKRLSALEDLGRWDIPVSTGIIVGVGEKPESWAQAARVVSGLHRRHRHIQNFIVQPFVPVPFSPMALHAPVTDVTFLRAATEVREALHSEIPLTLKLQDRLHLAPAAVRAGALDFGAIRLGSSERIEFSAIADIDDARQTLAGYGVILHERTALMEDFLRNRNTPPAILNNFAAYEQCRLQNNSGNAAAFG